MPAVRTITLEAARRLAISAQLLSGPRPPATADGILATVKTLGRLQLDPTSVVARSHLLVLWSRLGAYDPADLDELLWRRRALFEHRAYIVPADEYPYFRARMRDFPAGDSTAHRQVREWMAANARLRRSVLAQLRRRGPLRLRDFEDRTVTGWTSSGWNGERNVGQMLDYLLAQGKVMVTGREGGQRLWDLAERGLPAEVRAWPALPRRAVDVYSLERELRARPAALPRELVWHAGDRPPRELLPVLEREGRAVRLVVEGLPGERWLHVDSLPLLEREFDPRTTLLSPFDTLINERDRTEALWGFRFRLEIYVPKARREYGYFVLPILHGDRLVGRVDPAWDSAARRLRVNAIHWEPGAPRAARPAAKEATAELEAFLQRART